MRVTWYGHSCFLIGSGDYDLCIDPYAAVDGYPDLFVEAESVYGSHNHFDHNFFSAVSLNSYGKPPFDVSFVRCYHDEAQGAVRGPNRIYIFSAEGMRAVHMGDIGHQLDEEQLAAIRGCDLLMIPTGGTYTVDPAGARAIIDAVEPRIVVPMHYRLGKYGFDTLAELDDFLKLCPDWKIDRLDSNSFELTPGLERQIIVPKFYNEEEDD